jgi:PKD repeat protein
VLKMEFLFFCNGDCTNNNYHFQTVLALTTIFLIHQCVHFWGASTAQPDAKKPEKLQFSTVEKVSIQKRDGDFNVRICNGKDYEEKAAAGGVLAVMCPPDNGRHVKPQAGTITYNLTAVIPKETSGHHRTHRNGGITVLVEIESRTDPNVTITTGEVPLIIDITDLMADEDVKIYI